MAHQNQALKEDTTGFILSVGEVVYFYRMLGSALGQVGGWTSELQDALCGFGTVVASSGWINLEMSGCWVVCLRRRAAAEGWRRRG